MEYEVWNVTPPRVPARSRLYSLSPMGIGTAQVESLTSYVMRLANAHAVSAGTLMRHEILPNLPNGPKHQCSSALHSVNGLSHRSGKWVEVLNKFTARCDLNSLTLLPWKSVLVAGAILRRRKAWCPRCYQDCRRHGQTVYDPLLWMLAPVTICPRHETSLQEYCPHCSKRSRSLSGRARPGFCAHCNGWLGNDLPVPSHDTLGKSIGHGLQVAKAAGDLLAFGSSRRSIPQARFQLQNNIQRAIADWADGNRSLFCRTAKISDKSLTDWLNRSHSPSLPALIQVAHNLGIPLIRLLIEQIPVDDDSWLRAGEALQAEQAKSIALRSIARREPEYPMTRGRLWALSPHDREACKLEIKASMEAALDQDVPRSVRDIFRSLGYRQCVMGKYWFPGLYAAIQSKRKQRFDRYEVELRNALSETPPPTVAEVAQRLGVSLHSLRSARPALCTNLSLRYPDRRHFLIIRTEEELKKTFEETPASLTQLAARLHRNASKLRLTCPDICALLRQQYIAYRASERQRLNLIYEKEVRQAIQEITNASQYPSRKRVLWLISKKSSALTSVVLTARALKRIRQELRTAQQ